MVIGGLMWPLSSLWMTLSFSPIFSASSDCLSECFSRASLMSAG